MRQIFYSGLFPSSQPFSWILKSSDQKIGQPAVRWRSLNDYLKKSRRNAHPSTPTAAKMLLCVIVWAAYPVADGGEVATPNTYTHPTDTCSHTLHTHTNPVLLLLTAMSKLTNTLLFSSPLSLPAWHCPFPLTPPPHVPAYVCSYS